MIRSFLRLISLAALVAPLTFMNGCGDDDGDTDAGRTDGGADSGADTGGADADDDASGDAGGDDGGSVCDPECDTGRTCCDGVCVNTENDPRHCGGCGATCEGADNFCTGGSCEPIPCEGDCTDPEVCCGTVCCGDGQICCDPQGPVDRGPTCVDPDPDTGVCPQGCAPTCMCNAPNTPIATPDGSMAIADLNVGDLVYSLDDGAVVIVPIIEVRSVEVPADHRVVHLVLDDGTEVEISPSHPLADGRTLGDLRAGSSIEGVGVRSATLVPYSGQRTYDILPASDSGTYFVGDALIGSTIVR